MSNFICDVCNKEYKSQKALTSHKNFHRPEHVNKMKNRVISAEKIEAHVKECERTKLQIITEYEKNPNMCPYCNKPKGYKSRNNKFCSQSCAASFTNTTRPPRSEESRLRSSTAIKKSLTTVPRSPRLRGPTRVRTVSKRMQCTVCSKTYWNIINVKGHGSTVCSDKCYIHVKKTNATGIKRQSYNGKIFDSGWEVIIAKWLDDNRIDWIIPTEAIV